MQISWVATDVYRAFVHEEADDGAPRFCLVSSRVAANGEALIIDNALVVGMDDNRRVCDLELSFKIAGPLLELEPLPQEADAAELETFVVSTDRVRWLFNREVRAVQIEVGGASGQVKWHRLGANSVWLGISESRELRAVLFLGAMLDPTGQEEAHWLDEIGADR
jgi:hypothetical protein